jgi:hypothetical protein
MEWEPFCLQIKEIVSGWQELQTINNNTFQKIVRCTAYNESLLKCIKEAKESLELCKGIEWERIKTERRIKSWEGCCTKNLKKLDTNIRKLRQEVLFKGRDEEKGSGLTDLTFIMDKIVEDIQLHMNKNVRHKRESFEYQNWNRLWQESWKFSRMIQLE